MDNAENLQYIAKGKLATILLLLIAGVLLTPALFFGFELCDSGFYATFYDQIFERPESVSYNFMYYLSGIAGGIISMISGGSLLAIRIAGLLVCLGAVYFITTMSRDRESIFGLVAGTIVVCVGIWQSPLSLYNDNITATIICATFALLAAALRSSNHLRCIWLIAAAGAAAGLNTWTRIPNILDFLFILLIPLSGKRGKECWKYIGIWTIGWTIGILIGIGIAAVLGHLGSLRKMFADLFASASASSDESTHSIASLVGVLIDTWFGIIKLMIKVSATGGIAWYISRLTNNKWIKAGVWIIMGIPCLIWLAQSDIVTSVAAISLFGCLGVISTSKNRDLRIMAWSGLLMMAIMPMGSDGGIYNAGTITLWLGAPPAFEFLRKTCGKAVTAIICATLVISGTISVFQGGFYFDSTPVPAMTGEVKSPLATGLFTSEIRAKRINTILRELEGNISHGEDRKSVV